MISVAAMCHPKRAEWVPDLVESIDASVTVVWDRYNDRWDTGRRALLAHHPDATHHLVVQDDAIVCRDLVAGLEQTVDEAADNPIGLYVGTTRPRQTQVFSAVAQAERQRSRWVRMPGPWWGVGIVVPVDRIIEMVRYGDARPDVANYDLKITRYFASRGKLCWYTMPSLVDHRHGPDNPSLIPGRTALNRQAHRFLGADASALDDWSDHG